MPCRMSSWRFGVARRKVRRFFSPVLAIGGVLALLAATLAGAPPAIAQPARHVQQPAIPKEQITQHTLAKPGRALTKPSYQRYNPQVDSTLPGAGSAVVRLPRAGTELTSPKGMSAAVSRVNPGAVRAGTLPVLVGPAGVSAATRAVAGERAAVVAEPAPSAVAVTLSSQRATLAAGVHGILFSVAPATGATGAGAVDVSVDDSSFAAAYGGEYASRLRLVEVPACALTTPQKPACQKETPLSTVGGAPLTARVTLPSASATTAAARASVATAKGTMVSQGQMVVLAATSGSGGSSGTYAATSLTPAGTWSSGGNTGSFNYSYPITVPSAIGGPTPTVSLDYDSSAEDGYTEGTNDQSSWVGDGWDTSTDNYIERTYESCSQDSSTGAPQYDGDECWDGQVLTMSLNGQSTQIVYDDSTHTFHPVDDAGDIKVSDQMTCNNGTWNNECFEVIENGIQYWFGMNQLPGWQSGDQTTNSAWTVPVYCVNPNVTCSSGDTTAFAGSSETEGWRWNLDYMVDQHGNATAYYYTPEQNYYGADMNTTPVAYDRGGYLDRIDYGMTSSSIYSGTAPEQVVFGTAQRCIPGTPSGNTCDDSQFTVADAAYWPDVPIDQNCPSTGTCDNNAPTFWSRIRLTSIITQVRVNGATQKVDEYDLTQTFPDGGDHAPTLWLQSIQHTGWDTLGGGTGSIQTPALSFGTPLQLPNRVGTLPDLPPMYHDRIQSITTPTGAQITISYNGSQCTPTSYPSNPATNTMTCFPVYWAPPGATAPELDWFQKYTVKSVETEDLNDENPDGTYPEQLTSYVYAPSGMAWHYDDDETVKAQDRTYGQYRGYAWVETITGDPDVFHYDNGAKVYDQQTMTKTTYFQGMSQDTPSGTGGTTVSLTSSFGGHTVQDVDALAGQVFETDTYTSAGSNATVYSATVTVPQVIGPTASRARTGLPALTAQIVVPQASYTQTTTSTGDWDTEDDYFYNTTLGQLTTGMPVQSDDRGQVNTSSGTPASPVCSWTRYVENSTAMLVLTAETITADQDCTTAGAAQTGQLISDTRTSYDGHPWTWDGASPAGTAPTLGEPTQAAVANGTEGVTSPTSWVVTSQTSYDSYGRVATVTRTPDSTANGSSIAQATITTYSPATGLPTGMTVKKEVTGGSSPTYQTTSETLDPARGLVLSSVNVAGETTTMTYDVLGRLTAVWEPNESEAAKQPANEKYSYVTSQTGPQVVTTSTLEDTGSYAVSATLYDAMLDVRQTQQTGENNTTIVSDTQLDSHGWTVLTNNSYTVSGSPSASPPPSLIIPSQNSIPSSTVTEYDGMGRPDLVSQEHDGTVPSGMTTTTAYNGADTTTVVPPTGGTPTTTVINALGQTTGLKQYTSLTSPTTFTVAGSSQAGYTVSGGTTNDTSYTYTPAGQQQTITGPDGKQWSSTYDLMGRQLSQADPDTGASSSTYDDAGDVLSATDSRGKTVDYTYDLLDRKLSETDASNGGATLATWTWDTVQEGQLSSETSYQPGPSGTTQPYTIATTGYTNLGKPMGTKVTLPSAESPLPATYTTTYSYTTNDQEMATQSDPKIAGLPGEIIDYGYDALGNPTTTESSIGTYVSGVAYTSLAQPSQVTYGPSTNTAWQTYSYDSQTQRLTGVLTSRTQAPGPAVDNTTYTYDASGNPLSVSDQQEETGSTVTDTQCFAYNTLDELTTAWTATDNCANQNPAGTGNKVSAGAEAYLETFAYDSAGDRTQEEDYGITGSSTTTSTTYGYTSGATPASTCSDTSVEPHTLTSMSVQAGATNTTTGFCYDAAGDMVSRTPSTGTGQTMTWNDAGQLQTITNGSGSSAKKTSFVYTADGQELIRRDPGQTTLFAGDTEIMVSTSGSSPTLLGAVRYYTLGGSGNPVAGESSVPGPGSGLWYQLDTPQGTATMTMDATTQAISREVYSPYGKLLASTGTWPDTSRGYLGQPTEPASSSGGGGYDDLGAREYDPVLGRFISADPVLEAGDPEQLGGYTYSADNPVAGSDPDGLYYSNGGSDIGGEKAVDKETNTLYKNEAAQAESATIDTCANVRCAMDTVRNYSDPDYAAAAGAQFEEELEVQAGIQQEEADAQAAAEAASSGSGLWGEISDVVSTAATVLTVAAIATSWVPGLDCVTGALAIAADVTDAALIAVNTVDAYNAASSGDWAGAAGDVAMAALSFAGGGGESAAGDGVTAMNAVEGGAGSSVGKAVIGADGKVVSITLPGRDVIGPGSSQPLPDGDALLETEPKSASGVLFENEGDLSDAVTTYSGSVQSDTGGHVHGVSDHVSGTLIMGGMLGAYALEKIFGKR